ncbi:MFS transporter [Micromonospora zamorensis]|uniref:MFS transporter n=1 Tax=Micromonospora zamorensis TaxID=709883 RepID=UPI003CEA1DE1
MHRSQEDTAAAPEAGEQTTRFGPLQLSTGTTRANISGYYWLALTSIMTFTFIPAAQTALLTSILGVPKGEQGSIVGTAGLISEIVLIAAVGLAGAWSDRLGRRPIVVGGYILLGFGVGMAPFVGSVLPYYLARGVAAVGVAMVTVMLTAVVADYVKDTTRGRANGILGFCNGLGALVTFFVLIKLPDIFEGMGMDTIAALRATYLIVGGLALLTAILMRLTLRGGLATTHSEHIPIPRLLREGVAEIRRPGVSFAYLSAFVARADLALVGAYLTLWAQQYGTQHLGLSEAEALAKAGLLLGVANGIALIGAPAIGIIADRLSRTDAVLISLGTAALGYTATIFVGDPFSPLGYAVAALIGLGQVSAVISSQVLIAEQAPSRTRGSVIGTFALSGGIGIMIAFAAGGTLYDNWRPAGPFVLFGILAGLACLYGLAVRSRIPNHPVG